MPNKQQLDYIYNSLKRKYSPEQKEILYSTERFIQVAGGERGGKSFVSGDYTLGRFYEGKLYWLVGDDYETTRPEYEYICSGLEQLGWNFECTSHIDPGRIDIEGGITIITKSAKMLKKLASTAPDGIIMCEAAQLPYEAYLRLRGRVAEKRGWLFMAGTFESSLGWYPENYSRWQGPNSEGGRSFSLPSWSNTAIYPGGRNDPEILAMETLMSEDWFDERLGGVPCPPRGRVFNEFSNPVHVGMGGDYEFDASQPCWIWIDPGYNHYYAVLVAQRKPSGIYIVDEVYENNLVTSQIITACQQRAWWNNVIGGAIDIAARQHQGMPAVAETWLQEAGVVLRSQKVRIQDGIEVVKRYLKVNPIDNCPGIRVNARCTGLISEMGGCPNPHTGQTQVYKWRLDKDSRVIGDTPSDMNNDASKALAYGLVDLVGFYVPGTQSKITKVKFV